MDDIRVPVTAFSFLPHSVVTTPNNGVLYVGGGGGSRIGYIGDVKADVPNIDHFHGFSPQPIRAIDCDPDWSENQQFAVLTSKNLVYVWDLNKKQPILGHKSLEKNSSPTGTMCYLKTKKIIAIDGIQCVIYCVSSNTYSLSTGGALLKNNAITLLKACPYDENLVAAGTKNGLILIGNVSDFSVLHKLRGHDSDITCIDWIKLNNNETVVAKAVTPRPKKAAKSKRKALPIVDANDMFDIYSFDYLENEFGTLSNVGSVKESIREEPKQELNVPTNESFDFVEACQSLKEDILRPNNPEGDEDNEVHQSEIPTDCMDGSDASHSDEFVDVNDTLPELDEDDESSRRGSLQSNQSVSRTTLCVVTSSRESFMWIWDVNAGAALEKITLKTSHKASDVKFQGLTAKWLNEKTLMTNSPNGDLIRHNVSLSGKKLTCTSLVEETLKEKLIFNFAVNQASNIFWSFSLKRTIVGTDVTNNHYHTLVSYFTLAEKLYTIQESPHDTNKIAVAGKTKSIYVMDASSFTARNMSSVVYANRIKAKVISVAWHPASENLLAFSTTEGRVGVLDINKASNFPITMKPFTSEEVYKISWGHITDKWNNNPHWALFACSKTKLVYFPEKSKDLHHLCEDKSISTVSAGKKWLSIGSQDGFVYILKLNGLKIVASCKISNRYLYECAWNPNNQGILAACSDEPDIYLFNCSNADSGDMHRIGILKGHTKDGVPSIKWSNEDEQKLVSTGYDGTVRVWNVKSLECISIYQSRGPSFCAIFWPIDENYVICGGNGESLYMYDTRTRMDKLIAKPGKEKADVEWAALEQIDSQQLIAQEKKVNRRVARKNRRSEMSTLSESLKDVKLDEKLTDNSNHEAVASPEANGYPSSTPSSLEVGGYPCSTSTSLELNHTTVFYLSNKEFNKNVMQILNEMVLEDEDVPNRSLHTLLFSGKEEVKKLLDVELENHKSSKTDSVGHVLIPQLNFNLETEINEFIATKKLQPQHVSLAPMISYQFWKKCCKALANQYLEKNCCLLAVPYLLAVHEINDAIEQLCNAKYYREAWIIAKVYKESDDDIFIKISKLWSSFLEENGNLDGAALIAFSVGKFEMAHKLLSKKRTKTESVEKMIEILTRRM